MIDIVMEWFLNVALFAIPLAGYSLYARLLGDREKINAIYSRPEWNFILKKWYAFFYIRKRQRRILDKFENNALPSLEEEAVESPQYLNDEESIDGRSFIGCDAQGNSIWLKITKKKHRTAEVWLHMQLSNGAVYQLPSHPHTVIRNDVTQSWNSAGLKFQICEPFKRWRITYNGLLRKGICKEWNQNEEEMEHVRFNLIWTACSRPFEYPGNSSSLMLADAVAREPWRSGDWACMLEELGSSYEQWGMLFGSVETEDEKTYTVQMDNISEHFWGLNPTAWQHRRLTLRGTTSHGLMYTITLVSSIEGTTHATYGHVRQPTGKQLPINSCDLSLPNIAEHPLGIPKHFVFRFSAGRRSFTAVADVIPSGHAIFYGGYPWESQSHIRSYQFLLNNKPGAGVAEFWYRYDGESPEIPLPPSDFLLEPEVDGSHIAVTFSDRECQSSSLVGGKGASLALMASASCTEFHIPPGFCLTTCAFECQVQSSAELLHEVRMLKEICSKHSSEELRCQCEKTVEIFEKTPVCEVVRNEILKVLHQFDLSVRYAVRSSAIGEDSEDLSAAGQNATFLGVKEEINIIAAIQKCWASLYSFQSVQYRRQNGQAIDCSMGVVVQQMIPADVAGIMFTRHPVSGNPKEILLTANYGLGESVVSASADVDTIILTRAAGDRLSVKSSTCGKKHQRIDMSDTENGTKTTEVSDESIVNKLCISNDEAISLGKIGILLETMFGAARDIEWAVHEGKFYVLQARPITALHSWNDYELLHELDGPVCPDVDVFTTANLGEVFPDIATPLTQSFVIVLLNDGMKKVKRSYYTDQLQLSHHHVFLNILNVILREPEKELGIANQAIDLAVFGHKAMTQKMLRDAKERHGTPSISKLSDYLMRVIFNKRELSKALKIQNEFKIDVTNPTSGELYSKIQSDAHILREAISCHSNTSQVSVISQIASMIVLTEGSKDITVDHAADISLLLSQSCNIVSGEIPKKLKEIASEIFSTGRGDEFCSLPSSLAAEWLEVNAGDAQLKFKDFLTNHGHRSIQEFDLVTETWSMKPVTIIETLQSIVRQGSEKLQTTKQDVPSVEDIIGGLKSIKNETTRKILRWLLPWCQKTVSIREATKASVIKVLHQFRLAFRYLGFLMVKESRLPDPDLVFYMTFYELGHLLKTRDPLIINKAIMRKRQFPKWRKLRFPEIVEGAPVAINDDESAIQQQMSNTITLQGTPVTRGNACGRACVVPDLSQISQLQPGDILITQCTDIGWTPYFPLLSGVITEIGGLISHGAVIAREYGLPCIVGVQNATKLFKTGDIVLLAATAGTLQKVGEEESEVLDQL